MDHYPKCLFCFLDDDFQADLRLAAQQISPRHERVLQVYGRLFVESLKQIDSVSTCSRHSLIQDGVENEGFRWWMDKGMEAIRVAPYDRIFDEMKSAYSASISGRFGESYRIMDELMKSLGVDELKSERVEKVLYFRGRKGRFGREDLYHIPFSKRHFISNQRYSVTGQPLLYLGLSVLDVAAELGVDPLALEDFSFSTFYLKDASNVRVLDLGNSLYHRLWNNIRGVAGSGFDLKGFAEKNPGGMPDEKVFVDLFNLFTIASVCSFRRRVVTTQDAFAPEYVLPQALAHWAREQNFKGILYTSTRIDSKRWKMTKELRMNRYRENVAFFTNYDALVEDDHDHELLRRFEISPPVQFHDVRDVSDDVMAEYRKKVSNNVGSGNIDDVIRRSAIDLDVAFDGLVNVDVKNKEIPYAETQCGKVQRYLQLLFLMARLIDDSQV